MSDLSLSLEQLALDRLTHHESRLTTLRKKILAVLEHSRHPVTVTDIADQISGAAQSSIYRNLSVLVDAHLVTRIVNEHDFAFFELDEHVLGHHHHLRCTQCGNVLDIELPDELEKILEKTARSVARSHKYSGVHHHLDFTGLCSSCSATSP